MTVGSLKVTYKNTLNNCNKSIKDLKDKLKLCYSKCTESKLSKVHPEFFRVDSLKKCGRKLQYKLYVEYLNYTLRNLIDYRNQQKAKFTLDEIMYVLNCMVEMYNFLDSNFTLIKVSTRLKCRFTRVKFFWLLMVKWSSIHYKFFPNRNLMNLIVWKQTVCQWSSRRLWESKTNWSYIK